MDASGTRLFEELARFLWLPSAIGLHDLVLADLVSQGNFSVRSCRRLHVTGARAILSTRRQVSPE